MKYRINKYLATPVYDAEDGTGGVDDAAAAKAAADKAAAEKAAAEKAAGEKSAAEKAAAEKAAAEAGNKTGLSDEAAKLLKENMAKKEELAALKAKLKEFDGIDVAAVKQMLANKAEEEKKAAEAKGDFERVKTMMAEEHQKALKTVAAEAAAVKEENTKLSSMINELTIGQSFAGSEFVTKQLVLPIPKARTIYGSNFEIEDGQVVAYDKPKGAPERTKLVDATGKPLPFESAIERIVKADPDHASLLKSTLAAGARSKTNGNLRGDENPAAKGLTGQARIKAILDAQGKK